MTEALCWILPLCRLKLNHLSSHTFYTSPHRICVHLINYRCSKQAVSSKGLWAVHSWLYPSSHLQSSSRTRTSPGLRGRRWCRCAARRWVWSPTGPRHWRLRSNAGEPSPPKPPASPVWTRQGSPSTSSHTVTRRCCSSVSHLQCFIVQQWNEIIKFILLFGYKTNLLGQILFKCVETTHFIYFLCVIRSHN